MFSPAAHKNKETNIKNAGNSISSTFVIILFKLPCQRLENGEKPKNRLFSNASGRHISSACSKACLNVSPDSKRRFVTCCHRKAKLQRKSFSLEIKKHCLNVTKHSAPTRLITLKHVWNVGVDMKKRRKKRIFTFVRSRKEKKAIRLVW